MPTVNRYESRTMGMVYHLGPPPFSPMPTVVAALAPLAADPLTLAKACRWLTTALVFEVKTESIERTQLMNDLHPCFSDLLTELQLEGSAELNRAVGAINPTELYEPIIEHLVESKQLEKYAMADALRLSDAMHQWLQLCVMESQPSAELKSALLATLNLPYMSPYTGVFPQENPDDYHTIHRLGFTGRYGSTYQQYCFEEVACAFSELRDATERRRGTRRLDNDEVYHMLRELARISVNVVDAYLALPEVIRNDLWDDRNFFLHASAHDSYESTVSRMLDPENECPVIVKQALIMAGIEATVGRLLLQAFSDMALMRRLQGVPNPEDSLGFMLYRFVILAALQRNVDFDGQIRAVVYERFDDVWEEFEPQRFPQCYRPFGFPDEMSPLREMLDYRLYNGNGDRGVQFEVVDVPIEAVGPRIDPLTVATIVPTPERPEEDQCNICLVNFSNDVKDACLQLACEHFFHESCLDELLNTAYRTPFVPCPLCRTAICPARDYQGVTR